jgi:LacI family transcriptional regulator, gluconate utilization system Gnt-I transcriptional repressor
MLTGREGMAQLLDEGYRPDAIFCSSDALAQGVVAEVQSHGMSIPKDVAVMGFGDLSFAAYTFPALTMVRIDRRAISRIAADAILARMDGGRDLEKVIDIGFEVIERAST